jgi:hypothetical protein
MRSSFSRSILVLVSLAIGCTDDGSSDPGGTSGGDTSADTQSVDTSSADTSSSDTGAAGIEVIGDAFAFTLGVPYGRIEGTISILEQPDLVITSDAEGHFVFDAVPPGSLATFVLAADGFPPARTKTFTIPETGPLERVTFQIPDDELVDALAAVLEIEVDPQACQIVSTVTRVGKSIYDEGAHGEAGATVTLEPAIPAEHGPVYFNESVIPDRSLTESSEDGGVLYANVPAGTYTMRAQKDGVTFEAVTMECAAGVLVNASPPYGLQAL